MHYDNTYDSYITVQVVDKATDKVDACGRFFFFFFFLPSERFQTMRKHMHLIANSKWEISKLFLRLCKINK